MAGKGRASVNDMKRVEVLVLMEIDQQTEDNGGPMVSRAKRLPSAWGFRRIVPAPQSIAWIPKA